MNEKENDLQTKADGGCMRSKFELALKDSRKKGWCNINNAIMLFREVEDAEPWNMGVQYHIGLMYYEGREAEGFGIDFDRALCCFKSADKKGHACSQFALGRMHEKGEVVKKKKQGALCWYRKAAEHGCESALFKLGSMYNQGEGVTRDKCKAFIWFYIAKENGQEGLDEVLKQLREEIEKEQEKPLNDIEEIGSEIRRLCKVTKKHKEEAPSNSLCAVCCKSQISAR